jgi:hypothetical protein
MRDTLFRKDPLDKISSPDKTDQLIVQPRLSSWVILIGLLVILVALFFGLLNITILTTVDGNGIFISNISPAGSSTPAEPEVLLFIPFAEGQQVRSGMTVHVSPLSFGKEEYAYLEGTITDVTPWPVTREGVVLLLNNNSALADFYLSQIKSPPLIARVTLTTIPGHPDTLEKSGQAPARFTVHAAAPCQGQILIRQQKVYEKFFPRP